MWACVCVCVRRQQRKVGQCVGQPEHTGVVTKGGRGEDARRCENAQVSGCCCRNAGRTLTSAYISYWASKARRTHWHWRPVPQLTRSYNQPSSWGGFYLFSWLIRSRMFTYGAAFKRLPTASHWVKPCHGSTGLTSVHPHKPDLSNKSCALQRDYVAEANSLCDRSIFRASKITLTTRIN